MVRSTLVLQIFLQKAEKFLGDPHSLNLRDPPTGRFLGSYYKKTKVFSTFVQLNNTENETSGRVFIACPRSRTLLFWIYEGSSVSDAVQ